MGIGSLIVPVARNSALVIERFGKLQEVKEGGENGDWKFVWPWETVLEEVNMGLVAIQILRGENRRLWFLDGLWIDFQEAVGIVQITDVRKAVYDVTYEDQEGILWSGLDGAMGLMRVSINNAMQAFMKGRTLEESIFLSGPDVTQGLTAAIPQPSTNPSFVSLGSQTGIALRQIRLSGVTLSPNYTETMEGIGLSRKRLDVEQQRRDKVLEFLQTVVADDKGPENLKEAVDLLEGISRAEMLQNMSGQMILGAPNQMRWMLPNVAQVLGGSMGSQPTSRSREGGRSRQKRQQNPDESE